MIRGALVVTAVALLSALAPLAVYTISLAAFGLLHVLCELRYVDARFTPRIPRRTVAALSLLLLLIALLRTLGFAGTLPGVFSATAELSLVALLVVVALPHLRRFRPLGLLALALFLLAIFLAPLAALPILALLHNLTPVGFLAEALPAQRRRQALVRCSVVFLAVPAVIACGRFGPSGFDPLGAGPLRGHLGAFLPREWTGAAWASSLFAAAVYLQVMHYVAVVYLLPRLSKEWRPKEALLPWPRPRLFHRAAAAAGALLFVAFALSFRDARAFYGIAASVHAWVEIPLLLMAPSLGPPRS